jgi:cyclopropane fatty-acyl-phospholipid synthase-like methyltransferase
MTIKINDNWYEDFFTGINCELWENAVPPEWTNKEVDFLVQQLGVEKGAAILDIPCGFGRHAIDLAQRGFKVTGVDISARFVKNLNEKVKAENLNIQVIEADVLELKLSQQFLGAICMGNSFGYFDFDKMKLFVETVAAALTKGARFIINSGIIAESILPNFESNKSFTVGDITMDVLNTYDAQNSYMASELTYTKNGASEQHAFKHYVFTLSEVTRLLALYGLRVVGTYNSPDGTTYKLGDAQIYIVAQKV